MHKDFEQLPHTADIKIRAYGQDLPELFRHALSGMFQVIKPHAPECRVENDRLMCDTLPCERSLDVHGTDWEMLLVEFLSEALYLSDVHNEAYLDAAIQTLDELRMIATLKGVRITGFEVVEIKAVTYHELKIQETPDGWIAEIVFDI